MEVQVVPAEVGEAGGGEADAADAAQHQRVAGDLHDHRAHAGLSAMVASSACRSGASGVVRTLGKVAHGRPAVGIRGRGCASATVPISPVARPAAARPRLDQVGRGGLAVGAGDAEDGEPAAGLAVHAGGHRAEHAAGVVDHADRHARSAPACSRPVGSVRTATAPRSHRVVDEPGAVGAGAGQSRVEIPGPDLARGEGDAADADGRAVATAARRADEVGQGGEGKRLRPGRPGHRPVLGRGHGAPIYRRPPRRPGTRPASGAPRRGPGGRAGRPGSAFEDELGSAGAGRRRSRRR